MYFEAYASAVVGTLDFGMCTDSSLLLPLKGRAEEAPNPSFYKVDCDARATGYSSKSVMP